MTGLVLPLIEQNELVRWFVVLGVGGILTEIVRSITQKPKMNADTAQVITEAATRLLAPLNDRVEKLTSNVAEADSRTQEVTQRLHDATTRLAECGAELEEARVEIKRLRALVSEFETQIRIYQSQAEASHEQDHPPAHS